MNIRDTALEIKRLYDGGLSGMDAPLLNLLIELGDQAETIARMVEPDDLGVRIDGHYYTGEQVRKAIMSCRIQAECYALIDPDNGGAGHGLNAETLGTAAERRHVQPDGRDQRGGQGREPAPTLADPGAHRAQEAGRYRGRPQ